MPATCCIIWCPKGEVTDGTVWICPSCDRRWTHRTGAWWDIAGGVPPINREAYKWTTKKKFKLEINGWMIEWDKDYGYDKRTGWSVARNGSFLVQLEPSLLRAIYKALS